MPVHLEPAKDEDAPALAALRLAAARELTALYGEGTWSFAADSVEGVRLELRTTHVFLARRDGRVVATLRLSERNPWLGNTDFFTPAAKPLFLTSMAVAPDYQRRGIGRQCLADVERIAREWKADAIRLDSYDAPAGAARFYARCGYRVVRRGDYHGTPLIWFERRVEQPA